MESSALVYIFLTVITVAFALLIRNRDFVPARLTAGYGSGEYQPFTNTQGKNLVAEFVIYALLMGVSACRVAVGNDYWVYRDNFTLIAQERHVSSEIGFNLIVKWIQLLFGYDHYKPVFAFFSIVTVFFFVKALHDQASDYAFSLFLLLTGGFYFNSLNSVRYYLAIAVAMYAMKYIFRKEYGKFILWIALGAIFHKTILLTIPVYLMAWYLAVTGLKKWHYVLGGGFALSFIFGQSFYRWLFFKIYPHYEDTMYDVSRISWINILKCACVLVLCLICYRDSLKEDTRARFYAFLNLFGLVVFCCGSFLLESTRIAYYMIVGQVFLLPMAVEGLKNPLLKRLCKWGVIAAFCLYFAVLLRKMYEVDLRLLPYLNWIFN